MAQRQNAFEVDALNSSHPLSPPAKDIQDPGQIEEMFSSISYLKVGPVTYRDMLRRVDSTVEDRDVLDMGESNTTENSTVGQNTAMQVVNLGALHLLSAGRCCVEDAGGPSD